MQGQAFLENSSLPENINSMTRKIQNSTRDLFYKHALPSQIYGFRPLNLRLLLTMSLPLPQPPVPPTPATTHPMTSTPPPQIPGQAPPSPCPSLASIRWSHAIVLSCSSPPAAQPAVPPPRIGRSSRRPRPRGRPSARGWRPQTRSTTTGRTGDPAGRKAPPPGKPQGLEWPVP